MEGWVDLGDRLHTRSQTVIHLSINPVVHSRELISRPINHKSDAPNHYTTNEWVSSFLTAHQHNIIMQCHTIKIAQKLSIYNRFKNDSSNEIDYMNKS